MSSGQPEVQSRAEPDHNAALGKALGASVPSSGVSDHGKGNGDDRPCDGDVSDFSQRPHGRLNNWAHFLGPAPVFLAGVTVGVFLSYWVVSSAVEGYLSSEDGRSLCQQIISGESHNHH